MSFCLKRKKNGDERGICRGWENGVSIVYDGEDCYGLEMIIFGYKDYYGNNMVFWR